MLSGVVGFLAKGGPVMIPLAVCSVLAVAVVIERALAWLRLGSRATRTACWPGWRAANDLKGALDAFERAAKHAETKEQAAREIEKVKAALRK